MGELNGENHREMFRQACTIEESIDGEVLISDRFSFFKHAPSIITSDPPTMHMNSSLVPRPVPFVARMKERCVCN